MLRACEVICSGCKGVQRGKLYQLNVFFHVLGRQVHEIVQFWKTSKMYIPLGILRWDPMAPL